MSGVLYVVATPIGNLKDITIRAVDTLQAVDVVACEDTRRTEALMRHLHIRKRLLRYDEHTHAVSGREIEALLTAGKSVALVSDAGTPAIADPGSRLVADLVARGHRVVPIPGACAVAAALSGSGVSADQFVFLGFLPRRAGRARRVLQEALGLGRTVVLFESPFRVQDTLAAIDHVSPGVSVVVARELTKVHEEFLRGRIDTVTQELEKRPTKGEVVIIVDPAGPAERTSDGRETTRSDEF
jgi:16S rRNA (cytidine1402-2'-O)-methyltransferase